MKKLISFLSIALLCHNINAQTNPAITSWIRNTTAITGRHYVSGSSTPITDAYLANVQTVQYSTTSAYITCTGIPSYIIGPYLDGNPSQGADNHNIYQIPLTPVQNTGADIPTTGGTIGVFINGVSLFDYRDGYSYKASTGVNTQMGGDGVWNRDAILAEKAGFDCAKGHPAMTNYHHHQNPSAFNLDRVVISSVCNLYLADGLYVIDTMHHSPLIGYAYDGFPIYGAYGYKNTDGTGGIVRMKSSYSLRSITARSTYYTGATVAAGPAVSAAFPLGMYREDYQFTTPTASQTDYLDIHNGRFCKTPEYPAGTYAYFCTVDSNHNSTYPYVVGPTFYGTKTVTHITSVPTGTTTYNPSAAVNALNAAGFNITVYPNPASDLVAIQCKAPNKVNLAVTLTDMSGRLVQSQTLYQGSTMCYFDLQAVYGGNYIIKISDGVTVITTPLTVTK